MLRCFTISFSLRLALSFRFSRFAFRSTLVSVPLTRSLFLLVSAFYSVTGSHWRLSIFKVVHVCFFLAAFLYSLQRFSIHRKALRRSTYTKWWNKTFSFAFFLLHRLRCVLWSRLGDDPIYCQFLNYRNMRCHSMGILSNMYRRQGIGRALVTMDRSGRWVGDGQPTIREIARRCSRDKIFYAKCYQKRETNKNLQTLCSTRSLLSHRICKFASEHRRHHRISLSRSLALYCSYRHLIVLRSTHFLRIFVLWFLV